MYQCRKHMGYEMAKEAPTDAELVMPFPDSGVYAAIGFAHAAGVPYEQAYIRNTTWAAPSFSPPRPCAISASA